MRRSLCLCILSALAWGSVGGSISGVIKDPSGRVVPDAQVTVRQVNTGLAYRRSAIARVITRSRFCRWASYELEVQAPGFSGYQRSNVVLDTNAAITIDASLESGQGRPDGERERQCAARGDRENPAW